ncbi:MAG: isopentenyl phosphate kinase [Candidatus Thorarchaeota archaeon]
MTQELTVLKLGGALITDKSSPYSIKLDVLKSAANEIRTCIDEGLIQRLVIIHGVGSFGHPPVLKYNLHRGYQGEEQLLPFSWTQAKVNELRTIVMNTLHNAGIRVVLFHPSSFIVANKMQVVSYFLEPIQSFIDLNMVPLIGGDIVVDRTMKFSIGSGDAIAALIAREMNAKRVIFATDVSGVFDNDPKVNPNAELFDKLDLSNLDEAITSMGKAGVEDASGAMKGKIASVEPLKDLIQKGLDVSIISMTETGNLKALLKGDTSNSTQIVFS